MAARHLKNSYFTQTYSDILRGVSAATVCALVVFAFVTPLFSAPMKNPSKTPTQVDLSKAINMRINMRGEAITDASVSSPGAVCVSRHDKGAAWAVDGWIVGNELYKSYQNPLDKCSGSYPFTVTEVNMILQIHAAGTTTVAIDLEKVDSTTFPGCPVPGDIIYIGPAIDLPFPGEGLYNLQIVLDTPKVVSGPFFVGFYFAEAIDPNWHLELVTDTAQRACVSFNVWDTAMGYIDLGDDVAVHQSVYSSSNPCYNAAPNTAGCFDFDGRVILHTTGTMAAGCCKLAGDANNDGWVNITDVTFVIARIFLGGFVPPCADQGDTNGDNSLNITDVTYLISYVFTHGPAPKCGTTGI